MQTVAEKCGACLVNLHILYSGPLGPPQLQYFLLYYPEKTRTLGRIFTLQDLPEYSNTLYFVYKSGK